MKGVTKPATLKGTITQGPDAYANERVGLQVETVVDRTDFGINWNADLPNGEKALGNDVSYGLGSDDKVGVLIAPTPGLPNTATKPHSAAKPVLSRTGGYIDGAVTVTASTVTDGAQLWYTIDGSTPTAGHGALYSGAISINRTTTLRMVATRAGFSDSLVASATYLVMDEVLAQSGTPLGWSTAPVNSQVYQFGFDQDYIDENRAQVAAALLAAPTFSITTDLDNLIDRTTGIYSNPYQSGAAWERPASMELIDGDSGFQINGGIRLKGGYFRTPTNPKHSFRLTFGPGYEGPLEYPIFGSDGPQTFASVDLRTEQNYGWQTGSNRNTMLRDLFTRDSQAVIGDSSTRSEWVHLFLNGQYWGLYMLRDDISAAHAARVWGGSTSDYDVLKHLNDYGYEVQDGDDDEWLQLWDAISDGRLTDDEFASVAASTDLVNLADFMLINIAVGNIDTAPGVFADQLANNWQAIGADDQPFRFFLDDCEHTLGAINHGVAVDHTGPYPIMGDNEYWEAHNFNPGWLHEVLTTRAEYREIVRARAAALLAPDGAMGTEASLARWNALRDRLDPLIEAEAARWGYAGPQEFGRPEWEAEVEWVETAWFPHRPGIVRAQLRADHVLEG